MPRSVKPRPGVEQASAELQQRQAQVMQAAAQVLQSQAAFDIAKINYDRDHSLFQKDLKAIAKQEVERLLVVDFQR